MACPGIFRPGKDNAYVERTHRTDDEEFYVPALQSITGLEEHFIQALKYIYTFPYGILEG